MKDLKDMSMDEIIEDGKKLDAALTQMDKIIKTYEDGFKRMDAIERMVG